MPILGAHMSIAGGYFRAVEGAAKAGCDCVQVFTKNNNQWRAKAITDEDATRFRDALVEHNIQKPLSHASYLINLASPDSELRTKSINAMVVEVQRAEQLGIPFVVVHPGSFTTTDEATGLKTIAKSLDKVHKETKGVQARILLENTAGQGTNLGWQFEQLQTMIDATGSPELLGVCIDTCHAFAAGYPLNPADDYEETIGKLGDTVGLDSVKAFHLNDSKKPFGSRRDRHENIGEGEMGLEPFRILLNDPRWRNIPMYLETPKGERDDRDLDEINLETLRGLVAG